MNTKRFLTSTKIASELWDKKPNNFNQWVDIVEVHLEEYEMNKKEKRAKYLKDLEQVHSDNFDPKDMK